MHYYYAQIIRTIYQPVMQKCCLFSHRLLTFQLLLVYRLLTTYSPAVKGPRMHAALQSQSLGFGFFFGFLSFFLPFRMKEGPSNASFQWACTHLLTPIITALCPNYSPLEPVLILGLPACPLDTKDWQQTTHSQQQPNTPMIKPIVGAETKV